MLTSETTRNVSPILKEPIGAAAGGGFIVLESALHLYLSSEAYSIKWDGGDPMGRKKHCFVNCVSTRVHLGNPIPALMAGYFQEGVNMIQYWRDNNLGFGTDDSARDINANYQGQAMAYIFWRGCQQQCENCQ